MRYNLSKQENSYFCVPACLQAVLRNHNLELTQKEIAEQISCTEEGANLKNVAKFLSSLNFSFAGFNYNEVPLKEPELLLREHFGKSHILIAKPHIRGHHHILLEDFLYPQISVADPEDCRRYIENLDELYRRMWQGKKGGFDLISKL